VRDNGVAGPHFCGWWLGWIDHNLAQRRNRCSGLTPAENNPLGPATETGDSTTILLGVRKTAEPTFRRSV
jgi:hypothetical protein